MKTYSYNQLNKQQLNALTKRPAINFRQTYEVIKPILQAVKKDGDEAIKFYTEKFDGTKLQSITLDVVEPDLEPQVKEAFKQAAQNIKRFHECQQVSEPVIETMPGVTCFRQARPIEKVGLYIPGGTAPLASTVLMLGIPAKIAGCQEIIHCTPPPVAPEIIYAAKLCGIKQIYQVGGAQAIASMAYGTETVPQVYKIFGPGNQYVTAAKQLISLEGIAIDMPAGPSELLIIADNNARPDFVAADLLSQAEHGPDSQVVLACLSKEFVKKVSRKITEQLQNLPRKEIAKAALANSFILVCDSLREAISFSNQYAPEHLILNLDNPEQYLPQIQNAGSVFLGAYSCESAGDYASGTNHTLPTYGAARAYSGVSLDSYTKKITFQKLTKAGAKNLGPIVETMAEAEQLIGHKNAMTIRLNSINK